MITPNSIHNPPAAVGSANGTPVYASNLVNSQYMGLGLGFGNSRTAITSLNGVPVCGAGWSRRQSECSHIRRPTSKIPRRGNRLLQYVVWSKSQLARDAGSDNGFRVNRGNDWESRFSLAGGFGRNGLPLNIAPVVQSVPGSNGEQIWTFTGSGIYGFTAVEAVIDPLGPGKLAVNPAWGVAAVSFTPPAGQTPEPSSVVLAGMGALGLAVRFGWRRSRGTIA